MSVFRQQIALVCLCIMSYAFQASSWAGGEPVVWLALGEVGGVHADAAKAVAAELQRTGTRAELIVKPWRELPDAAKAPRLIVAIGVGAWRGMAASDVKAPLLATLVPRSAYQVEAEQAARGGRAVSALWLDQPVARQLDLLKIALPARSRVGVLLGPDSRLVEQELMRAAAERNLEIVAARVGGADQLPAALQRVLGEGDVLLALPDPQIYNGATIQNVLTSAYRHRLPLVGFSPAYVKAGAMLSVYSTPTQLGTQVGEIVRAVLGGRPLSAAQGPRLFSIGLNADVARSLGIVVVADAETRWAEQLRSEAAP